MYNTKIEKLCDQFGDALAKMASAIEKEPYRNWGAQATGDRDNLTTNDSLLDAFRPVNTIIKR